jgi:hypothetical protein
MPINRASGLGGSSPRIVGAGARTRRARFSALEHAATALGVPHAKAPEKREHAKRPLHETVSLAKGYR